MNVEVVPGRKRSYGADYLEGGEAIEDSLEGFPSVKREQVIAVIEAAKFKMLKLV